MLKSITSLFWSLFCLSCLLSMPAMAQQLPKIAVTDLSYEETVSRYFQSYELNEKHDDHASSREHYRDSDYSAAGSSSDRVDSKGELSIKSAAGEVTIINRGELRKFTADVKGELLKSGAYGLIQGKPWTSEKTDDLYDIIKRIKDGYYPGADYVLFGSINNVEWRNEVNPIQGSTASNYMLALELVAEFSLINTRTYEIKAAFSAMGEGSDSRLISGTGTRIHLNRSKVMQDVSRSLGTAVAGEMEAQFVPDAARGNSMNEHTHTEITHEEHTVVYK